MRIKFTLLLLLIISVFTGNAQVLQVTPAFPTTSDVVTVIYDATEGNGALTGVSQIYAHAGVITDQSTSLTDWKFVQGNWGTADPNTIMTSLGNDLHQITINMTSYYGFPAGTNVEKLAFVFRNADGSIVGRATDGSDIYYEVFPTNAGLLAKFFKPYDITSIATVGQTIEVDAAANNSATLELYDNGTLLTTQTNSTTLNYNLNVTTQGLHTVELVANDGAATVRDTFYYTGNPVVTVQNPPSNLENGINYINDTTVILQLHAPFKNFVYVLGDFNNWTPNPNYFMKRSTDNETWWLEITGLSANQTTAYQYWVDGTIKIADPYSELILDPNSDGGINNTTFPNMHPYPSGQTTGFVTVLHPGKPAYNWQVPNFVAPAKTDLVIYEMLVRDFVATHNYQTIIDSLDYLSNLGINALELMPPGEFENNESWGYNPSFHMALDKYYGTPEKFKELIDACHQRGIAVIIDMVLNHAYGQNPLVNLYWNAAGNKPSANSPYFNADCPHAPYCWGYDLNHASPDVHYYVNRINKFWLEEYKVDGFRFDYTKGFTNAGNVGFNADRIQLLKDYSDAVWAVNPNAYMILEHWADNNEETQLSNYGMMMWGNVTYGYANAMKGYTGDIGSGVYTTRGWSDPNLITFIESHDEERAMYAALTGGNQANPAHNPRVEEVALRRMAAASAFFYTIPGPKMVWQFQEVGYDISIDNPCRVCNKPILWNYFQEINRKRLYDVNAALINLKTSHDVFRTTDFNFTLNGLIKRIRLNDPTMDVVVIGNFNVNSGAVNPAFQSTGMWYEFFTGDSLMVTNVTDQITLQPAEYRLYTSQPLNTPSITNTRIYKDETLNASIFPNPAKDFVNVAFELTTGSDVQMTIYNWNGQLIKQVSNEYLPSGEQQIQVDVNDLPFGNYILQIQTATEQVALPIIKF
jgi:1,4-alpha-glucan branching enzyme